MHIRLAVTRDNGARVQTRNGANIGVYGAYLR